MKKELKCLRCDSDMRYISNEKIQLGQTSWFFGDLPNLLSGSLELSVYSCPMCGKVEFFQSELSESQIAKVKCPVCGKMHDIDYPKCPFCKFDYQK